MHKLKTAFMGAVFGALALATAPASAIPISDLSNTSKSLSTESERAAWVCGRDRCWWRPVFVYPAPYIYDRPYRGPYWGPDWGWRRWYW
jgi:hypothetical protein